MEMKLRRGVPDENPAPGFHWAVNANQSRRIDVNGPVADGTRGGNASQGRWQHGVPLLLLLLLLLLLKNCSSSSSSSSSNVILGISASA